ncbi:MAG: hypothetical protein M3388_09200 [Acidobacteriota bacterium]|nr:hypothetical protein [Acidobacteriota bacterium]
MKKRFSAAAMIFVEMLIFALVSWSQDIEANIKVLFGATVRIEGRFLNEKLNQSKRNWAFLRSITGANNLGARITDFYLTDKQGRTVFFKKLIDGEYLADGEADFFQYQINLSPLPNAATLAHVSWLKDEQGILMLDDLLPQFSEDKRPISAKLKLEVPPEWKIISSEKISDDNVFYVKNIEKAVFAVGKNWRAQETSNLNLAILGEWQFTDAEAAKIAGEIFDGYRKLFGEIPAETAQIFLHRFPKETKFGRWEAETRGANLTILSSDVPFKTLSLQRFHEQLRHELFHLWIPNNLALTGNYDWFYEGFTVYQALRTGIATNQIRFEDFLDTLAQAYNLNNFQSQKVSLIESSKNRWSGVNSQAYARGMLVAFLCELTILKQSRGKHSIDNIFKDVYQKHRVPNKSANGNAAILKTLNNYSELNLIIKNYVEGAENIIWITDLANVGIEAKVENSFIKLSVKTKLSGKQKDLLDKLGYNNWRKISEKSK